MIKSAITIANMRTKHSLFRLKKKKREKFWYIELLLAFLCVNRRLT